jgi:hypothetical protein
MENKGDNLFIIKRTVAAVILCLMISGTALSLIGCTNNENTFYTDYFYCMYNDDKTEVTILELTDKGQEQEVLIIPETINGLRVSCLGGITSGYPYQQTHKIKSDKLRKIYINSGIDSGDSLIADNLSDVIIIGELRSCWLGLPQKIRQNQNIFLQRSAFELYSAELEKAYYKNINIANISFYIIDNGTPELIWIDNYSEGNLYLMPDNFGNDWYLDKECTIVWNGERKPNNELNIYTQKNKEE